MDIFAHMLWTNVVYRKKYIDDKKNRLWAVFFGVVPDLVSFVPATIYGFFHLGQGQMMSLIDSQVWVFVWARNSYNFTHSLVVFSLAVILVCIIRKGKIYWPMFGWLIHILIDIPSHKNFYETPFLYPFSNYKFDHGVSWSNPIYMLVNYGLLAIIYLIIFFSYKQYLKNKAKNEQIS
jgi:membrane-bound metal-dependent hydrolase YbcI (DUF457 family)